MARNRIIYASQSVWCNGDVLYRVQSLGTTTTFTSEDIFELGHLDIVDIVDDVPAVAVTLNTNDFGDVATMATLAQVPPVKRAMNATATDTNGNLVVVSGTNNVETSTYLHGACLADFAVVCGNLPGVTVWAPVQDECSLGTLDNNIDQSLFLDKVYVNSLEFGYTTGANATENYGAETDNKMWLLNDGRFVNQDSYTLIADDLPGGATEYISLTLPVDKDVAVLSSGLGFLRKDENGTEAVTWYDNINNEVVNIPVITYADNSNSTSSATHFVYYDTGSDHQLWLPTAAGSFVLAVDDRIEAIYAADAYGTSAESDYFATLDATDRPDFVGAIRQGQVEVYIVEADAASYDIAWRLTGCTITSDLTREPLAELGHLAPYDRPLTLPIPITVTADSTAGDLENWSKVADKLTEYDAGTLDDIDLADLMASEDLKLVVKIYAQTDEEAGGTGANREVAEGSDLITQNYWNDGTMGTYSAAGDTEYPLKTIIVEHLKITDEGMTLDMGANATQTFGFRSTNDLYVVKGDISIGNVTGDFKVRRNG
jgi:hypothetical protein